MTQIAVIPFAGTRDLAHRPDRQALPRVGCAPAAGETLDLGGTVTW